MSLIALTSSFSKLPILIVNRTSCATKRQSLLVASLSTCELTTARDWRGERSENKCLVNCCAFYNDCVFDFCCGFFINVRHLFVGESRSLAKPDFCKTQWSKKPPKIKLNKSIFFLF